MQARQNINPVKTGRCKNILNMKYASTKQKKEITLMKHKNTKHVFLKCTACEKDFKSKINLEKYVQFAARVFY